jgi:hypothetical protein
MLKFSDCSGALCRIKKAFACFVFAVSIVGCSRPTHPLIGIWRTESDYTHGIEFREDGTTRVFAERLRNPNLYGEWRQEGQNRIRQSPKGEMGVPKRSNASRYIVEGDKLTLIHDAGGKTVYYRQRTNLTLATLLIITFAITTTGTFLLIKRRRS